MKSATIPPLRVTPQLRRAAEDVLHEGETLSNFVEESLRDQIERRRAQQEFLKRGLAAGAHARATGTYVSQADVMTSLRKILTKAERQQTRRR